MTSGSAETLFAQLTAENKEKVNRLIETLKASQSDRQPACGSPR